MRKLEDVMPRAALFVVTEPEHEILERIKCEMGSRAELFQFDFLWHGTLQLIAREKAGERWAAVDINLTRETRKREMAAGEDESYAFRMAAGDILASIGQEL
jgi:hypothetical protein